jgi:transcriptional regulator with XRE-family HTH domain
MDARDEEGPSRPSSEFEPGRVAERLRGLIGNREIRAFAEQAGLSEGTLRNLMKGGVPKLDSFMKIASAAGVSVEWLATGQGSEPLEGAAAKYAADPANTGLTLEDVQAIVSVMDGLSALKGAPLEERAKVWMELINSQLKNRARLRAEALEMLKAGPPQPD